MNKKILLWGLVILILIEGALGLGLRPARTIVDFEAGKSIEDSFWVVNNDQADLEVDIYIEGELSDYIEIEEKKLILKEDDDSKKVNFKMKLPEKLPAGEVKGNIVVEEKLKEGGNPYDFSAKLVLKHKITVNSPYPDKFVEGKINFEDKGDKIGLISEVKNLGSKTIEKIMTKFYINDQREEIGIIETGEGSLSAGEKKILEGEIDKKKVEYGEFDILAAIIYDDYKLELEKKLVRGEPEIEIVYFDKYFVSGKINRFTVDLLNRWNKKLEKVFVDIFVFKEGREVDKIKTNLFEIEGEEMKAVEGYFDTKGKETGDYDFEIVVDYEGKKTQKKFKGSILEEEDYKEATKGKGALIYILIGILFGLVIVVIAVLLALNKRWKEKKNEEKEQYPNKEKYINNN